MPKQPSPCDHDCFRCPYDDCICPDEDISPLEQKDAREREREINRSRCAADADGIAEQERIERAERNRLYAKRKKLHIRQTQAEWYANNRETVLERSKAYYAANRDRINAERRESYARARTLRELADGKKRVRRPRKQKDENQTEGR